MIGLSLGFMDGASFERYKLICWFFHVCECVEDCSICVCLQIVALSPVINTSLCIIAQALRMEF